MTIRIKVGEFPLKVKSGHFVPCTLYRTFLHKGFQCKVQGTDILSGWYTDAYYAVGAALRKLCNP